MWECRREVMNVLPPPSRLTFRIPGNRKEPLKQDGWHVCDGVQTKTLFRALRSGCLLTPRSVMFAGLGEFHMQEVVLVSVCPKHMFRFQPPAVRSKEKSSISCRFVLLHVKIWWSPKVFKVSSTCPTFPSDKVPFIPLVPLVLLKNCRHTEAHCSEGLFHEAKTQREKTQRAPHTEEWAVSSALTPEGCVWAAPGRFWLPLSSLLWTWPFFLLKFQNRFKTVNKLDGKFVNNDELYWQRYENLFKSGSCEEHDGCMRTEKDENKSFLKFKIVFFSIFFVFLWNFCHDGRHV